MEKSSSRKKKDVTYTSAFEDEDLIVFRKVDFQEGISTLLYYAWKHRNSESHLYALYNYIQSIQCLTLRHKIQGARAITPWPQPLFGTLGAPQGVTHYPPRNALLPGNYYPDHARIMVFGSKEQGPSYSLEAPISTALDSSEAKVLNIQTEWNLPESQRAAEKAVESYVKQVCDSSLAGLAHNPFWTSLYAFLLVGPYFSLFAWKTRPDAEHLQSLPTLPNEVPRGVPLKKKKKATAKWNAVIQQRVDRIKRTPLPEVIYYNEPMFTFKNTKSQKWYDKARLSPKYLHALSLPTTSVLPEELVCQPSWFGVGGSSFIENNRRVNVRKDVGLEFIQKIVIDHPVQNELAAMHPADDQPDPTLAGPKPPDSSDSQQSRFSEVEPQVVDPNAGPHQMRTRASTRGDVEDLDQDLLE